MILDKALSPVARWAVTPVVVREFQRDRPAVSRVVPARVVLRVDSSVESLDRPHNSLYA